jgi:uncharacterized coiled-coil DUF342 family protein
MLKEMLVKIDKKIDDLKLEINGVTVEVKEIQKILKKDSNEDENTNNNDADDAAA